MNDLATMAETAVAGNDGSTALVDDRIAALTLDDALFDKLHRRATVIATSGLMPPSVMTENGKPDGAKLPLETQVARAFLIVAQAHRWGMDPFAVVSATAVVHGKLCYEGKLVAAVLQQRVGIRLHHRFIGEGDAMRVFLADGPLPGVDELAPGLRDDVVRIIDGTVGEWKTSGSNSPWRPATFHKMLVNRGTREWARLYEPAVLLGVYTPDEMDEASERTRAANARDVTPRGREAAMARLNRGHAGYVEGSAESRIDSLRAAADGEAPDVETSAPDEDAEQSQAAADGDAATGDVDVSADKAAAPAELILERRQDVASLVAALWQDSEKMRTNGDVDAWMKDNHAGRRIEALREVDAEAVEITKQAVQEVRASLDAEDRSRHADRVEQFHTDLVMGVA